MYNKGRNAMNSDALAADIKDINPVQQPASNAPYSRTHEKL